MNIPPLSSNESLNPLWDGPIINFALSEELKFVEMSATLEIDYTHSASTSESSSLKDLGSGIQEQQQKRALEEGFASRKKVTSEWDASPIKPIQEKPLNPEKIVPSHPPLKNIITEMEEKLSDPDCALDKNRLHNELFKVIFSNVDFSLNKDSTQFSELISFYIDQSHREVILKYLRTISPNIKVNWSLPPAPSREAQEHVNLVISRVTEEEAKDIVTFDLNPLDASPTYAEIEDYKRHARLLIDRLQARSAHIVISPDMVGGIELTALILSYKYGEDINSPDNQYFSTTAKRFLSSTPHEGLNLADKIGYMERLFLKGIGYDVSFPIT